MDSDEFSERWGVLYEELKTRDRWQLGYYLAFAGRRATYLLIGLYVVSDELLGIQWQSIMYLNLFYGVYLGATLPWQRSIYNKVELMNELFTAFATMQLVLYTDYVTNLEMKTSLGWMLIGTIMLFFTINMYFILRDVAHSIWLLCMYVYVRIHACLFGRPNEHGDDVDENIHIPAEMLTTDKDEAFALE